MPNEESCWLRVRIPKPLHDLLRETASQRKTHGATPDTIQGMVAVGMERYIREEDRAAALTEALSLLRQASVDMRHFGLRDFATKLLRDATRLGADPDVSDLEGTGGEETRRS